MTGDRATTCISQNQKHKAMSRKLLKIKLKSACLLQMAGRKGQDSNKQLFVYNALLLLLNINKY